MRTFPAGQVRAQIVFGSGGNSEPLELDGWSFPESGFTWSQGRTSRLRLPAVEGDADWLLALEGSPFLAPPELTYQTAAISLDGVEIARCRFTRKAVQVFRLERHSFQKPSTLEISYSESCEPTRFGQNDERRLGIAWHRICLVQVSRFPSPAQDVEGAHVFDGNSVLSEDQVNRIQMLSPVLLASLASGQLDIVEQQLQNLVPNSTISLKIDRKLPKDISLVQCTSQPGGGWEFGFPAVWRRREYLTDAACQMVAWHWLATIPLFYAYSRSGRLPGSVILNLGDEPHARGLAFCGRPSSNWLIPDPYFIKSRAYGALKTSLSTRELDFRSRKPVALWRGSTTGYRDGGSLLQLPRLKLCLLAQQADVEDYVDAGLTGFVQLESYSEELELNKLGLLREFVPPERFPEWRFHIDIDGNTNSWPGLFQKLLSGSLVIKVTSGKEWQQWYYDRLDAFSNFVPVRSDLDDLIQKVKYFSYDVEEAQRIAQRGTSLAWSMSYEAELERATATMESAILEEAFLRW